MFVMENLIEMIRAAKFSEGLKCVRCSSSNVIKFGKYKGSIQRYKCNCCGKTFSDFSKTILARTHHREKWVDFLSCFEQGLSIRKCSEVLGISVPTVFKWRHKLLRAISGTENNKFSGHVEIGEAYFPENQKGNKNIQTRPSRDHSEYTLNRSISDGQIAVIVAKDSFNNILSEVCDNGRLGRNIIDEKLGPLQDNRIFNIDNVRKYIKELKLWMKRFRGVASKYLGFYLSWHKSLDSGAFDKAA
jgi:transposase-like protein